MFNLLNCSGSSNGEWLAYQTKDAAHVLVLNDLNSGKEKRFAAVDNYLFSHNGNICVINQKVQDSGNTNALQWMDLGTGNTTTIWHGEKASNYAFDDDGKQLAFIAEYEHKGKNENAIWYYKSGMDSANNC